MANNEPFNLFVYGTLMDPSVFRAVLGRRLVTQAGDADGVEAFLARDAVLDGYKKISPDHTYLYAVPERYGRIRGYVIGPLPTVCMSALRKYEGRNYSRKKVTVQTASTAETCYAFVGKLKQLEHSFGYAFRDPLKQEILLREKIEAALRESEMEQLKTDQAVARRAMGELHGATIRDLVRRHFDAGGISDYAIRRTLKEHPLRDFSPLSRDAEAQVLAPNYLAMVVRQVIFNEFEENIRREFRYEIDHMDLGEQYYERTVSSLAALRMLNENAPLLDILVGDCLTDLKFGRDPLVDYVSWSVRASDAIYSQQSAKQHLQFLRTHMGRGHIPLGTELEFSNIGHAVIRDPQGQSLRDRVYDGFLYFSDFALDALTWKVGGHVDDHREKVSPRQRRGFFEVALGNVSLQANLSKPITDDPWLLNQFIHEACRFYAVRPHSVHISLQLRSQHRPVRDRLLPLSILKCLFALAGGPERNGGKLQVTRLTSGEISSAEPGNHHLLFSDISKRHSREISDTYDVAGDPHSRGLYVQQFRFLRLSPELNYEPVAMALKGLQIHLRPGSFLTPGQYEASRRHRKLFDALLEWGRCPTTIPDEEVEEFLGNIHAGLMTERRGKPSHSEAYIAWSLSQLRAMIRHFNLQVEGASRKGNSLRAGS